MNIIRNINGIPTLMSGEKPLSAPVFDLFYDQALRDEVVLSLYNQGGIRSFAIRTMLGVGTCRQTDDSISLAVKRITNVAQLAPEADIIIDAFIYPAEKWLLAHPDEGYYTAEGEILVLGPESLVEGVERRRDYIKVPGPSILDACEKLINNEAQEMLYGRRRVSPFSRKYAQAASATIKELIKRLLKLGMEKNLWGIFLESYNHGEWTLGMYFPDYGKTAIKEFRKYLKQKYNDNKALRIAWNDPTITLKNALPYKSYPIMELGGVKLLNARDIDYRTAEAQALAGQFTFIAESVKSEFKKLALGGFFPGYSAYQSEGLSIYNNDNVDFVATPVAYENRGLGYGVNSQSPFCDGLKNLGKVWLDELDTRVHTADQSGYANFGLTKNVAESVELLWRDAGQMLVRGHHGWWLDFGATAGFHQYDLTGAPPYSWHLDVEILKFHKQFSEIWRKLPELDRTSAGELKVFTPSRAGLYVNLSVKEWWQRHVEWALSGLSIEYDVLENLLAGNAPLGKLNIIACATSLDDDTFNKLHRKIKKSKSCFIWHNASGMIKPGAVPDSERASLLSGITQKLKDFGKEHVPEAFITKNAADILGCKSGEKLGQFFRDEVTGHKQNIEDRLHKGSKISFERLTMKFRLIADDSKAVPVARYHDDDSIAVAMKKCNDCTSFIYNLPVLNNTLLKSIAKFAGCHAYTEHEDVVFASNGLILLHTVYSGNHTLSFQWKCRLLNLRTGQYVSEGKKDKYRFNLKKGETVLCKIEKK